MGAACGHPRWRRPPWPEKASCGQATRWMHQWRSHASVKKEMSLSFRETVKHLRWSGADLLGLMVAQDGERTIRAWTDALTREFPFFYETREFGAHAEILLKLISVFPSLHPSLNVRPPKKKSMRRCPSPYVLRHHPTARHVACYPIGCTLEPSMPPFCHQANLESAAATGSFNLISIHPLLLPGRPATARAPLR